MTSRDFCYWLQGFLELSCSKDTAIITEPQVECMRKHLALVFVHEIDPSFGGPAKQAQLNQVHFQPSRHDVKIRC